MKFFKGCLIGAPISIMILIGLAFLWIKVLGFDWQSGLVALFLLFLASSLMMFRPSQPEQLSAGTMQRIGRR